MTMPPWEELPASLRTEEVRPYYEALARRGVQLRLKRLLDVVGATILMVLLGWLFIILAALLKLDSPGPGQRPPGHQGRSGAAPLPAR